MKYKKIILGGALVATLGLLGGSMVNVQATGTRLDVEVDEVLTAVFETAPASVSFDENGGFKTGSMTIFIDSNSPKGVVATISTTATDANGSALKHTTSTEMIPTLTAVTSKSNFPANRWGFSTDNQTFYPVPSAAEGGAVFFTTTANGDKASKTKTVYFGVNVDDTQFEGDYSADILITVLANPNI